MDVEPVVGERGTAGSGRQEQHGVQAPQRQVWKIDAEQGDLPKKTVPQSG